MSDMAKNVFDKNSIKYATEAEIAEAVENGDNYCITAEGCQSKYAVYKGIIYLVEHTQVKEMTKKVSNKGHKETKRNH